MSSELKQDSNPETVKTCIQDLTERPGINVRKAIYILYRRPAPGGGGATPIMGMRHMCLSKDPLFLSLQYQ